MSISAGLVRVAFPLLAALPWPVAAQAARSAEPCRPASPHGGNVLERAIEAVGLPGVRGQVLRGESWDAIAMAFQSDRMYPPYLVRRADLRTDTDWERGRQRTEQGTAPTVMAIVSDASRRLFFSPRGGPPLTLAAAGGMLADERAMDPWVVLSDWRSAGDVRVAEECQYRDYWRLVLTRRTAHGEERLYVDPKTGLPIKLQRQEQDPLWGDRRVEYLWSIWQPVGSAIAPQYAFRIVEGETEQSRQITRQRLVPRDSSQLELPADAIPAPPGGSATPDTVRVAANTFLLVTQAYTNVVTLQRDTVFVLDAQTSEARARADSVWIGKLFPGRHPVVLVVTDLAWPHISGVRFWVASGAPVVSHRASRAFLSRVIEHRWTMAPDKLESRRGSVRLIFREVNDALDLAGGEVQLRAIDGVGSEGAVLAFLPANRFLYAGDYIQNGGPGDMFTAQYAREVEAAVRRAGFAPERFAAMHVPLSAWSRLNEFVKRTP
jgi:hypothetical protein